MINAFLALTTQVPGLYQEMVHEIQYSMIYHSVTLSIDMTPILMRHIANVANSL